MKFPWVYWNIKYQYYGTIKNDIKNSTFVSSVMQRNLLRFDQRN